MKLNTYNIEGRTIREEKLLSEGGYGYIFKVVDLNTREVFALKKSYCQGQERTQVAKNELQIMRSLPKHPNILSFIGGSFINEGNQQVCLILLEFCSGGSIFDLMAANPNQKISEHVILNIVKEITQGLKAMHSQNPPLAHRDIKIENVLFQNGKCKLCDFGSASTQRVDFAGMDVRDFHEYEDQFEKNTTLMYRPPEMCDLYKRYQVFEKVDLWMLGCVIFTMCFFIHPFQESSKLAISTATYRIPPSSQYSQKLQDLIRVLLTPDPKLRPSIFDLEKILNNWDVINYIPLNPQAQEIKDRDAKLELEMKQFEKNQAKIKKFDGDIPLEELERIKQKIQNSQEQPQQQPQRPKVNSSQQFQAQQRPVQQQKQQQNPFEMFNQAAQPVQNQQFGWQSVQTQNENQMWGDFNFDFGQTKQVKQQDFGFMPSQNQPIVQQVVQPVQQSNNFWDVAPKPQQQQNNFWEAVQPSQPQYVQPVQQSPSIPQQQFQQPVKAQQPQVVDLIGLSDNQQSNVIDLSNIIL
ncbi:hypothetical protein pb186bvf_005671 [Paramecium bursaria]